MDARRNQGYHEMVSTFGRLSRRSRILSCLGVAFSLIALLIVVMRIDNRRTRYFVDSQRAIASCGRKMRKYLPVGSYDEFLEKYFADEPGAREVLGHSEGTNTLPLPVWCPGVEFKVIRRLPDRANPSEVPLMWNPIPSPRSKRLAILFYDGSDSWTGRHVSKADLKGLLQAVARNNNGELPEIVTARTCYKPPK